MIYQQKNGSNKLSGIKSLPRHLEDLSQEKVDEKRNRGDPYGYFQNGERQIKSHRVTAFLNL